MTFTRSTSRHGRAVVLGALGLAGTLGLSATPAGAAIGPVEAKLRANPIATDYAVSVFGHVKITQAEAQGLIDSGHRIVVRVWGEDTFDDDFLLGPYVLSETSVRYGHIRATAQGLAFGQYQRVNRGELDEDDDPGPGGLRDELYAGVRLVSSNGTTIRSVETNRLSGHVSLGTTLDISCPSNVLDC